jgi:hypothetical protein
MGTFPNHGSTIFEMEQHAPVHRSMHATFISLLKVWVLQMIKSGVTHGRYMDQPWKEIKTNHTASLH